MQDNKRKTALNQHIIKQQRQLSHYNFFIYNGEPLIPGIVRMRDAPFYLGMNKTFFRDTVQQYLTRIPIDKKGIGFNRAELDRWIAYTQATIGQPPQKQPPWENSNADPIEKSTRPRINPKNLPKKVRIKKIIMQGKPTAGDLNHLVNQVVESGEK